MKHDKTIKGEFDSLQSKRKPYEEVWDVSAQYTLRELYLPDELRDKWHNDPSDMVEGDSIGADVTNNFLSVLQRTAFPPTQPFVVPEPKPGSELSALSPEQQTLICLKAGQEATQKLRQRGLTVALTYLIGRFVMMGNVCWTQPKDDKEKIEVYELNDVVVQRDNRGAVIKVILKDKMPKEHLPSDIKEQIDKDFEIGSRKSVTLYTMARRLPNGKFEIKQAVDEKEIDTGDNFYTPMESEIQFASLYTSRGRNYGVGVAYRYLKWLHAANIFADAKNDVAAMGSMVNWGVSPASAVRPEDFASREQGQAFSLRDGEIFPIVPDVGQQMQFAANSYAEVEQRLQRAFLMFTAVQRDAERVTAAEIRAVQRSLEDAHSGLYAQLAEEIQRPLAHYGLSLIDNEEIKPYVKDMVINLVAANEALGQNADLSNLLSSLNGVTVMNNIPPEIAQTLRKTNIFNTIFAANNVDPEKYIKSEEEQQAEREAAARAEQAQQPAQVQQTQQFTPNDELSEVLKPPLI